MEASTILSLITLVLMEVALGIDNVIFVAIIAGKLPPEQRSRARRLWAIFGVIVRVGLLALLTSLIKLLQTPLFPIDLPAIDYHLDVTGRHLILMAGGLFLLAKAVLEIHNKLEGEGEEGANTNVAGKSFASVMAQIMVIDLVFSIDSIVTAIGLAEQLWVMATAVIVALGVMLIFAKRIGSFVEQHPTFKILALSFLVLIGIVLISEGIGQHISKGYIYFAMAFGLLVELLNIRLRKNSKPVPIHMPKTEQMEG